MTTTNTTIALSPALDRNTIREIFLQHGFTIKEGQTDLKPYVYEAAAALVAQARAAQPAAVGAELPPLTLEEYGTPTALELERQRRADVAARAAIAADRAAQQQQAGAAAPIIDTPEFRDALRVYAENHGKSGEDAARFEVAELIAEMLAATPQDQGATGMQGAMDSQEKRDAAAKTSDWCPHCGQGWRCAKNEADLRAQLAAAQQVGRHLFDAVASPAQASAAQADEARDSQYVARLKKERDGWMEEAEARAAANAKLRQDLDLREMHQKKDVWFWQGDGTDYPESMSNSMAVVIRADQLKSILAGAAAEQARAAVPEGWKLVPVEPTDAMAAAAIGAWMLDRESINGLPQYRAMLAASPTVPAQPVAAAADAGGLMAEIAALKPSTPPVYAPVQGAAYRHGYRDAVGQATKLATERAPATSAAAQPVAKVGESADAKDAARYRWLREHWFYFGTSHSITTTLGANLHRVNMAGDLHTLDVALDANIADDAAMQSTTTGATDGAVGGEHAAK